jgi:hypothetical protein
MAHLSVNSIEWHKENLKNLGINVQKEELRIEDDKRRLERWKADRIFLQKQIEEAEKQNKTSFDSEKFLAKKRLSYPGQTSIGG